MVVGGGGHPDGMTSILDQLLSDAPEWQDRAACGEAAAAETFLRTLSGSRSEVSTAIVICQRCPVQAECGDHADASEQRLGVWGGVDRGSSGHQARLRVR